MQYDDSDHDQGFVPTKVQIKADSKLGSKKINEDFIRPTDFQPRYIFGDGVYRKQPQESYSRFQKYPISQIKYSESPIISSNAQQVEHPYEKYMKTQYYTLVYSRYKDRSGFQINNDDFTNNEMILSKVLNGYNKDYFSVFKNFQQPHNDGLDKQLQFDSRFEGGNLLYAFRNKTSPNFYTLFIQNDTNSNGYNQWFYFSLKNVKPGVKYKFSIVNFKKRHSFFKHGMKVAVFSLKKAIQNGNGWYKSGNNIKYERSCIRKNSDRKQKFYSLTFQLLFQNQNDFISIAMNQPYTYSRLIKNLRQCENINKKSQKPIYWNMIPITHSISNNAVPYLTITSIQNQNQIQINQQKHEVQLQQNQIKSSNLKIQKNKKKIIIIMARQHPGQTWSSFLMEQILYHLAQNSSNSHISWLLDNFIFKIFPMINVDGVIYGNFRCDIAGFDLNRNWKNPDKSLHPQVFSVKEQIQRLSLQNQIACVFDLHGHSKEYNIFCYSCKNDPITCRVLPMMIQQRNPIFHFPFCTFGISKYKQTTARAVIYNIIKNENVLTIENSFLGAKIHGKFIQFQPQVFKKISADIFITLQDYLSFNQKRQEATNKIKQNMKQYLNYESKANDSGSESDPYGDQISLKDKIRKILPKSFAIKLEEKEEIQKPLKKKILKKKPQRNKIASTMRKYETLDSKRTKNKFIQQQQQKPTKTFIQRTSLTQYKRNSKQISSKKFRDFDASISQQNTRKKQLDQTFNEKVPFKAEITRKSQETTLPFYLRDKPRLVPIKLKNDSLQIFKDAYEFNKKEEQEEHSLKKGLKTVHNKNGAQKKQSSKSDEFPTLCVLSQSKRKRQMERVSNSGLQSRQLRSQSLIQSSGTMTKFRTYLHNEKFERIKKSHQRQKHKQRNKINNDLVSKIWKENVARYGKNLNIFMGDFKN